MSSPQPLNVGPDDWRRAFALLTERQTAPDIAEVLLPLLVSGDSTDYDAACNFAGSYSVGPDDDVTSGRWPEDIQDGIRHARRLVASRGLPQTPPAIAAELNPTDDEVNRALDRRGAVSDAGKSKKRDPEVAAWSAAAQSGTAAGRQLSLANAVDNFEDAPTRGVERFALGADGRLHARRTSTDHEIDL